MDDDNDNSNATCDRFIGLSLNSDKASMAVLLLALCMLSITIFLVVVLAVNKIRAPTVKMVSTGHAPRLELPDHCNFHVFMSHVWVTGQAQTHAIARKMQLLLPELKVWLDVDQLNDTSKLEDWVAVSSVFILSYTKNYFKSENCRREVYAAMKLDKPILLVYEGDRSVIEDMKAECIRYCEGDGTDAPTATSILRKLLGDYEQKGMSYDAMLISKILDDDQEYDEAMSSNNMNEPIQWLNEGSFSAAALNQIYYRIISELPFYKRYKKELEKGVRVPGELDQVSLKSPINILVYEYNQGCSSVTRELKSILPGRSDLIAVTNVEAFMQSQGDAEILGAQVYFLLYLNAYTFQGDEQDINKLTAIVQSCIENPDISIVLAHEKDAFQGGCSFDTFFNEAPKALISPPYQLFKDIAIPLHSNKEYRDLSLRQILCKMGAKQKRQTP